MAEVILRRGPQDQKERGRYVAKADAVADSVLNFIIFYRIGEGFSETNESLNPQVQQRNYVNGKTSSITTGFQESWPVSGERYVGDYANDMFARMAETRAKGPDAAVRMVTVNFYEEAEDPVTSGEGTGIYAADVQPGSFSPESAGGGGATDSVTISGTVNGSGQPQRGWFLPVGAPTTDQPDLDLRDMGVFSTDLEELITLKATL